MLYLCHLKFHALCNVVSPLAGPSQLEEKKVAMSGSSFSSIW